MTATLVARDVAGGFAHRTLFEGVDLAVAPGDMSVYTLLRRAMRARPSGSSASTTSSGGEPCTNSASSPLTTPRNSSRAWVSSPA